MHIRQIEDQIRSLQTDQKELLSDRRSWDEKRPEFEKRDADIKSLLEQHKALKSVDGDPFAGTNGTIHDGTRTLKGVHAGIVANGFPFVGSPQLDLAAKDVESLRQAATERKGFAVDSKATDSTSIPQSTLSDYRTAPVTMRREPTRVLSLIPTFSTGAPSVTWYSTTGTTAAAAVAEGATKPTSTIAYSPQVGTVTKIAHVAEVTDETLSDFPAFMGVLQQDMFAGLVLAENAELISATVTGAHKFAGLLNTTGIQVGTAVPGSPTQTDRLDAIGAAMDLLRTGTAFAEPDGIVMHPSTWGTIKRNKDSQNRYLLSDPGSATDPRIWGVPVVLTTQIMAGTVLIGDFAGSTAAYVREGIRVETNSSGEAQFKNNTTLIRAEERLLLTVPRPTGLVKVTGF